MLVCPSVNRPRAPLDVAVLRVPVVGAVPLAASCGTGTTARRIIRMVTPGANSTMTSSLSSRDVTVPYIPAVVRIRVPGTMVFCICWAWFARLRRVIVRYTIMNSTTMRMMGRRLLPDDFCVAARIMFPFTAGHPSS